MSKQSANNRKLSKLMAKLVTATEEYTIAMMSAADGLNSVQPELLQIQQAKQAITKHVRDCTRHAYLCGQLN